MRGYSPYSFSPCGRREGMRGSGRDGKYRRLEDYELADKKY